MTEKTLKDYVQDSFDTFVDGKIEMGEVETVPNFVPYGDTFVNQGDYIEDDDMDNLKDEYIEWLQEDNNSAIIELLQDNEFPVTVDNINAVIDFAKEV